MRSLTNLTLAAVLAFSVNVFAGIKIQRASQTEKQLLCTAIDKMMELETIDAAIDMASCLRSSKITSQQGHEVFRIVSGSLKFNSPNRAFTKTCTITYEGQASISQIVGGVEGGVTCL